MRLSNSGDKKSAFNWKWVLVLAVLALCPILSMIWYWQRIIQPYELTKLYGPELSAAIASFESVEGSLDAQLNPEKILSVATKEYMTMFRETSTPLTCPQCDQFWVTTSAIATDVCVLEYSGSKRGTRATVMKTGYRVDAHTYEPVQKEVSHQDRSTYHFINANGVWKIMKITDYMPAAKGQADLLEVLNENWIELGCN